MHNSSNTTYGGRPIENCVSVLFFFISFFIFLYFFWQPKAGLSHFIFRHLALFYLFVFDFILLIPFYSVSTRYINLSRSRPQKRRENGYHRISFHFNVLLLSGWLGSRVVSVLGSSAEGPGFKSQSRRCRVTVLGKLFTPIVPLFTKQQNW